MEKLFNERFPEMLFHSFGFQHQTIVQLTQLLHEAVWPCTRPVVFTAEVLRQSWTTKHTCSHWSVTTQKPVVEDGLEDWQRSDYCRSEGTYTHIGQQQAISFSKIKRFANKVKSNFTFYICCLIRHRLTLLLWSRHRKHVSTVCRQVTECGCCYQ